ncbi:MAG TPA: hypothetical protein VE616_00335 [Candidatus Udaeobacter sp.]|jgi:hypothetical protein|nr:hypothetical protein [Candidatus Udaeobacter sp.]
MKVFFALERALRETSVAVASAQTFLQNSVFLLIVGMAADFPS